MTALAVRFLAFGVCVAAALTYGIVNEVDELPDSLDRGVLVGSVLATAFFVAVVHRYFDASLFLGVPFLSAVWAAAALGDFVPFALGLEGRVLNKYDYDMAWEFRLTLQFFTFALGGLGAGLISAAIAACILAAGRMRMPRRGRQQHLR